MNKRPPEHQGQWVLSYPDSKGRNRNVGPFPSRQDALDFPIDSDVCSVSPLYAPQEDMEFDDE